MDKIVVAAAQFDGRLADKQFNYAKMEQMAQTAKARHKADLILFPETALTGYCVQSREEAMAIAEPLGGEYVERMRALSTRLEMDIAFGMIERDGENCYNTLALCEPDGNFGYYHKMHLPFLGFDRFADRGDRFCVLQTRFGKIGLMICYDVRFPEVARALALDGARLILHASYMSGAGSARLIDVLTKARALENRVYMLSCNRVGEEGGMPFLGRSQIIDIAGHVLEEADDSERIISRQIDLSLAEEKSIVAIPGEFEVHIFTDRQPQRYGRLLKA